MFRRGGFREHFGQRFGVFSAHDRERFSKGTWIWVHSISVGETLLALKLVKQLLELDPELHIALSVTTSTGYQQAATAASERLKPIYNPLDFPPFVKRTLALIRPRRLVFIEAMWPNLLTAAKQSEIPIAMIPRLSPRSEARFRRFRWLTGPIFGLIDRFFAQDATDLERWKGLGVNPSQIEITGNIKFDTPAGNPPKLEALRSVLNACGIKEERPVLLGGSTFPGEEAILGRLLIELRARFPELFLIVVPRHFERGDDAQADLEKLGLRVARRTKPDATVAPDCLLVDTTGELRDWYHLSTVVFIGKSITAHGGQNPVEPVLAGKPVIYGPHMENFRAVVDAWRTAEAAIQVHDEQELLRAVESLLDSPALRTQLANRALAFVVPHTGATKKIARRIIEI
ncbi:3-deoxy-D-manno-octulosonic acid transferase [Verrucomicrobiota bacterium sgz303538]